jgi:hypothetical protein
MDKVGTYEGDKNLVEADNDPDLFVDVQSSRHDSLDSEDEKTYIDAKVKRIGHIMG